MAMPEILLPRGPLPVLYRDAELVAVGKPSGLAVHRGWAAEADVALQRLRDQLGRRVYPVHRLDRPTSGVLLFALSSAAAAAVQALWQAGEVEKRYLALVRGLPPSSGIIDHPVPRERKSKERVPAVTHFRRLATFERYALVEARPHTGRVHQIRRHMKHRSWPLIGDVHYGKGDQNRLFRARFGLHRLALHASHLSFVHPSTAAAVEIVAPVPDDLAIPLRAMGFAPVVDALAADALAADALVADALAADAVRQGGH